MINLALRSPAQTAIYPLQDILGLGSEARMNVPGREQGNWAWRFDWAHLAPELEQHLNQLTQESHRA
jgi:4-alpha-glucanotransferase